MTLPGTIRVNRLGRVNRFIHTYTVIVHEIGLAKDWLAVLQGPDCDCIKSGRMLRLDSR